MRRTVRKELERAHSMPHQAPHDLTQLLKRAAGGDRQAAAAVLPLVYDELRKLAAARMRSLPPGQTLQPTALVHEAYLRVAQRSKGFEGRAEFFFAAARAMKDILVDDARRKAARKRRGTRAPVEAADLETVAPEFESPVGDVILLDRLLQKLELEDPEGHRLVLLRYFTGFSMPELAEILGTSLSSLERKWRFVRAWLADALGNDSAPRQKE